MKARFTKLDQILKRYEHLWKPPAFSSIDSRLDDYPELQAWLRSLSSDDIDTLQLSDQDLLASAANYFPVASELLSLISVPASETSKATKEVELPAFWDTGIPGRKAAQIKSFIKSQSPPTTPLIEWCCGKLHLGRLISELYKQKVTGLEIDTQLVNQANILSRTRKLSNQTVALECDVLNDDLSQLLEANHHLIALHACGGLHVHMLKQGVESHSNRMTFSPCCYHRFNTSENYQALSLVGRTTLLSLSNEDLRLATRQCNTASAAETRKRKQLQAWRLGFDTLQKDIRHTDQYLPCPSLSIRILQEGFERFCKKCAQLKDIDLPQTIDFLHYQSLGQTKYQEYEKLELVRMLFRRALETWLVLDRCLFLEENGYRCEVLQFCTEPTTPRNLLIDARKQGSVA